MTEGESCNFGLCDKSEGLEAGEAAAGKVRRLPGKRDLPAAEVPVPILSGVLARGGMSKALSRLPTRQYLVAVVEALQAFRR